MKTVIILVIGAVVGVFGMKYHDDAKFAQETNAHINSAISQGADSAHKALESAKK